MWLTETWECMHLRSPVIWLPSSSVRLCRSQISSVSLMTSGDRVLQTEQGMQNRQGHGWCWQK